MGVLLIILAIEGGNVISEMKYRETAGEHAVEAQTERLGLEAEDMKAADRRNGKRCRAAKLVWRKNVSLSCKQ